MGEFSAPSPWVSWPPPGSVADAPPAPGWVGYRTSVAFNLGLGSAIGEVGGTVGLWPLPFLGTEVRIGELTIDLLHVNGPDDERYSANEAVVDFSLSPLIHFEIGRLIVVVGPKLGYFRGNNAAGWEVADQAYHGSGLAYRTSLGLFFPISPIVALGVLLNYAGHSWRNLCESDSKTWQNDVCNTTTRSRLDLFGLTAAMLF